MDEVETALAYTIPVEQWFQIERQKRAVMIAQRQINRIMRALNDHDRYED